MDTNQQNNSLKNKTTTETSKLFDKLKLDAVLWFCGAIILLLLLENLEISNFIEYVVLFLFGLIAVISTVVRANNLIKSQNSKKLE